MAGVKARWISRSFWRPAIADLLRLVRRLQEYFLDMPKGPFFPQALRPPSP